MRARNGDRGRGVRALLRAGLVLGLLHAASAARAQCVPENCDDGNPCTVDTCDPVLDCIYSPVDCDDGNACTVDSCSPTGGPGVATLFIGHDTSQLERQYDKIGSFVQTWGAIGQATGAAVDANGVVYICNPSYGNNVIERRGPGNTDLGTITATVEGQWIEDLGNFGGGFILAGTFEGDVFSVDTTTGAHVLQFATPQSFIGVTYDGIDIWTTGGYTDTLVARRDLAGNVLSTFDTGRTNAAIGYDPDDGTLWIGHANGQITRWTQTGTLLGGFDTAAGGQLLDGVELANLELPPGCQNNPIDCSDDDPCTLDACDPLLGCSYTPNPCDDANPCTDDACSTQTGCVHPNNNAACDDNDACTAGEVCSGGLCQGVPVLCDDSNACTTDSCDRDLGCLFLDNTDYCDDGDACTLEDTCVEGSCQPGFPTDCNDNNPCTTEFCNPPVGCIGFTNSDPCDDGDPCTIGDVCGDGACQPGTPFLPPGEAQNLSAASDKTTYAWSAVSGATHYDAVRGDTGALPVGSSGAGDEVCFHDLAEPTLDDMATPAPGAAFWYLSRARNPCGAGPWGVQSNGTARWTTACP